jgi:hypothetical protein
MNGRRLGGALITLVALGMLGSPPLGATTLLRMDLEQLVERSGKIFRGTVLDIRTGTVQAGGGTLPTVTYVLRVDEGFKGSFKSDGDQTITEITMLGTIKESSVLVDGKQRFSVLPEIPRLELGSDYLLFATPESRIGLSTSVGLGQGAFTIQVQNRQEYAVNALNNENLGLSSAGPVLYSELTSQVLALLGK